MPEAPPVTRADFSRMMPSSKDLVKSTGPLDQVFILRAGELEGSVILLKLMRLVD